MHASVKRLNQLPLTPVTLQFSYSVQELDENTKVMKSLKELQFRKPGLCVTFPHLSVERKHFRAHNKHMGLLSTQKVVPAVCIKIGL